MAELGERPAYVLAGEGWHPGVIGIVASRLVELSGRPVVMIALDGDTGKGVRAQRRGVRPARRADRLRGSTCSATAGTARRRGWRSSAARVEAFAAALSAHAERVLSPQDLVAVERVDAVVGGEELGMALAEELQTPRPVRARQPGRLADGRRRERSRTRRPMGEGKHVRFTVESRRRARAGGRVRQRRAAAGRRRRAGAGDVHAGGQRVERRQRAAPGAAPRTAVRASRRCAGAEEQSRGLRRRATQAGARAVRPP